VKAYQYFSDRCAVLEEVSGLHGRQKVQSVCHLDAGFELAFRAARDAYMVGVGTSCSTAMPFGDI
jgi:hypothetical protein